MCIFLKQSEAWIVGMPTESTLYEFHIFSVESKRPSWSIYSSPLLLSFPSLPSTVTSNGQSTLLLHISFAALMGAQAVDRFLPRGLINGRLDPLAGGPLLPGSKTTSIPTSSGSSSSSSSTSSSVSASLSSSVSSATASSSAPTGVPTPPIVSSSSSLTPSPVTRTTVVVQSSSSSSSTATPVVAVTSNTSFLQNRVASGFVFTIVGIFGLAFVFFIATFFIRRRKSRRLIEDAVSFDPVTVGYDDMEKARQSSSLGHGSHDVKTPTAYNHYTHSPFHYGGSPATGYAPHTAGQYAPPARYGSPPLPPVPMSQQHHLSYISSAEDANYSRPMSGAPGLVGGQVPEDIRRQYGN